MPDIRGLIVAALLALAPSSRAFAADAARDPAKVDYNRDVRPILSDNCFECHGPDEKARKSALRLDVRDAALKGGESLNPAITPGKAATSAVIARVTSADP